MKKTGARRRVSQIDLISTTSSIERLITELDEKAEQDMQEQTPSLPQRTPEPDWVYEFGNNPEECTNADDLGYKPKRCWCNRCQIMYRMHREHDQTLSNWGNYPCQQW